MVLPAQIVVCLLSVVMFRPSDRFLPPSPESQKWAPCTPLSIRTALTKKPLVCLCKEGRIKTQRCTLTEEAEKRCPSFKGKIEWLSSRYCSII